MDFEEIGAFEAKTRLSALLDRVQRGHAYRITKRGVPVAELRPVEASARRPTFGQDRGRVIVGKDFEAPLPEMKRYQ